MNVYDKQTRERERENKTFFEPETEVSNGRRRIKTEWHHSKEEKKLQLEKKEIFWMAENN